MVAQTLNRFVAPLVDAFKLVVEVIDGHRSRHRIVPGVWPRTEWEYPCVRRPVVKTQDGILVPVTVTLIRRDGYIYACGHQDHICRGEDVEAGGAFDRDCELLAERLALESL